jgi:hypothetical protein
VVTLPAAGRSWECPDGGLPMSRLEVFRICRQNPKGVLSPTTGGRQFGRGMSRGRRIPRENRLVAKVPDRCRGVGGGGWGSGRATPTHRQRPLESSNCRWTGAGSPAPGPSAREPVRNRSVQREQPEPVSPPDAADAEVVERELPCLVVRIHALRSRLVWRRAQGPAVGAVVVARGVTQGRPCPSLGQIAEL